MSDITATSSSQLSSQLMQVINADDIVPGANPSYELCKLIYTYHPLGAKMVDSPIDLAQSMPRKLTVRQGPDHVLIEQFQRAWKSLGVIGADRLVRNLARIARIYGIGTIVVGTHGQDPSEPIDFWADSGKDLYFNALDPLNTAGSLVLNQDPNSPSFLKPRTVRAGGQAYHPSRCLVMLNDEPLYVQWTNSAFGFVGRSVYQRALFPMKSFVQSMLTDDIVTKKIALLVYKSRSPSSVLNRMVQQFAVGKRQQINDAATGNVLQIGNDESVDSINMLNLEPTARFARENILKNIATAANMPASMINNETLAQGFGEGSEDAKNIARYIDGVRQELTPIYRYLDRLVMHRAWSPAFYRTTIQPQFPEYENVSYEAAFVQWRESFEYQWPNLLVEPDSALAERESKVMESALGLAEIAMPILDPENRARMVGWLAEVVNSRKMLAGAPLAIDEDALEAYARQQNDMLTAEGKSSELPEPRTKEAYDA